MLCGAVTKTLYHSAPLREDAHHPPPDGAARSRVAPQHEERDPRDVLPERLRGPDSKSMETTIGTIFLRARFVARAPDMRLPRRVMPGKLADGIKMLRVRLEKNSAQCLEYSQSIFWAGNLGMGRGYRNAQRLSVV